MAIEKRDRESGAKLLLPSKTERSIRSQRAKLKKDLEEVQELKEELKGLINKLK